MRKIQHRTPPSGATSNHRNLLYYLFYAIISTILVITTYVLSSNPTSITSLSVKWALAVILIFIGFIYLIWLRHKTLNKGFVLFSFGALFCWFGQIIIITVPSDLTTNFIIKEFSLNHLNTTLLYSTLSFIALLYAGLIFSRNSREENFTKSIHDPIIRRSMNIIGFMLSISGGVVYIYSLIQKIQLSIAHGYVGMYQHSSEGTSVSNLVTNLEMLFIPGIFILIVANKHKKRVVRGLFYLLATLALAAAVTGARATSIAIAIALFWIYTKEFSKLGKKRLIGIVVIGIIAMYAFNIIASFRDMQSGSIEALINTVLTAGSLGVGESLIKFIGELGFNIFSLYHTMLLIPDYQEFAYGYTYFAAAIAIIPSALFGGFSFSTAAALPDWLMKTLGMDYGPGYSIVAESYYNFGWLGIIAMFLIGAILAKMYSNSKTNPDLKSLRNALIATTLYATLFIARDSSLLLFRKYFYMVIIPTLLVIFLVMIYRRRANVQIKRNKS